MASEADYEAVVAESLETFQRWRMVPAPKRGQIVREIGDELRASKDDLGTLVITTASVELSQRIGRPSRFGVPVQHPSRCTRSPRDCLVKPVRPS